MATDRARPRVIQKLQGLSPGEPAGWCAIAPRDAHKRLREERVRIFKKVDDEPVWTISLAAIVLGESLQPIQLAGGALILVGVVIAQTGPAASRSPQPAVRIADE